MRDFVLLGLAAAAVILPIAIGAYKRQIPKELISNWAVPLAMVTFLLALGVQAIEKYLDPQARLMISILFSAAWIIAGIYTSYVQPRTGLPEIYHKGAKNIGVMFTGFGIIWLVVSLFQFFSR